VGLKGFKKYRCKACNNVISVSIMENHIKVTETKAKEECCGNMTVILDSIPTLFSNINMEKEDIEILFKLYANYEDVTPTIASILFEKDK
jgi:hypothetical protein